MRDESTPAPGHRAVSPLSPAQAGIWFAQRMRPDQPVVIAQYTAIDGQVDEGVLRASASAAARECGLTGARVSDLDGRPYLVSDPAGELPTTVVDLRAAADPRAAAHEWMRAARLRPVDLHQGPLASSVILRLGGGTTYWFVCAHHVVADTHTVTTLVRRTAHRYTAAVSGAAPEPFRGPDADALLAAEQAHAASARAAQDRDYWAAQLAGAAAPASLSGMSAPARADTHRVDAPVAAAAALDGVATAYDTTPAVVVTAAFNAYLARYTRTDDALLTFPVSGRTTVAARRAAGMLANTVPLRTGIGPASSVLDAVRGTQAAMTEAVRHQRHRWDDIVRETGCGAGGSFGPAVAIALADPAVGFGFARGHLRTLAAGLVDDLVVHLRPDTDGGLLIGFEGNPDLYSPTALGAHLMRFLAFLDSFLRAAPHTPVRSLRGFCAHLTVVR